MKPLDFEGAMQYALMRLEQDLPACLVYHSVHHTRDDVVPAVEHLAAREGMAGDALLLLRTAAWYHDIGFVEQRVNHEACGVRIAAGVLPRFGYSQDQIAIIGGMIMATKLPQTPQTHLEKLVADADLDVLGWPNFLERNQDLRAELAAEGTIMTDAEWYNDQLAFLRSHRYWSTAARALRDAQKQRNIQSLIDLLEVREHPVSATS